jgi:hypothetical protein
MSKMLKELNEEVKSSWSIREKFKNLKEKSTRAMFSFVPLSAFIAFVWGKIGYTFDSQISIFILSLLLFFFIFGSVNLFFPQIFNYKIKKKLKEKKYFDFIQGGLYSNKKLKELFNEVDNSTSFVKEYIYLIECCNFENIEDLKKTLFIHYYYSKNESLILENYIDEIKSEFNTNDFEEICEALIDNRIDGINEKDFFAQRDEIIILIKENIKSESKINKLADLMEEKLKEFNSSESINSKFDKISKTNSVNIKKKKAENFVLKSL